MLINCATYHLNRFRDFWPPMGGQKSPTPIGL